MLPTLTLIAFLFIKQIIDSLEKHRIMCTCYIDTSVEGQVICHLIDNLSFDIFFGRVGICAI